MLCSVFSFKCLLVTTKLHKLFYPARASPPHDYEILLIRGPMNHDITFLKHSHTLLPASPFPQSAYRCTPRRPPSPLAALGRAGTAEAMTGRVTQSARQLPHCRLYADLADTLIFRNHRHAAPNSSEKADFLSILITFQAFRGVPQGASGGVRPSIRPSSWSWSPPFTRLTPPLRGASGASSRDDKAEMEVRQGRDGTTTRP